MNLIFDKIVLIHKNLVNCHFAGLNIYFFILLEEFFGAGN